MASSSSRRLTDETEGPALEPGGVFETRRQTRGFSLPSCRPSFTETITQARLKETLARGGCQPRALLSSFVDCRLLARKFSFYRDGGGKIGFPVRP